MAKSAKNLLKSKFIEFKEFFNNSWSFSANCLHRTFRLVDEHLVFIFLFIFYAVSLCDFCYYYFEDTVCILVPKRFSIFPKILMHFDSFYSGDVESVCSGNATSRDIPTNCVDNQTGQHGSHRRMGGKGAADGKLWQRLNCCRFLHWALVSGRDCDGGTTWGPSLAVGTSNVFQRDRRLAMRKSVSSRIFRIASGVKEW